jgi:hypothetical protein
MNDDAGRPSLGSPDKAMTPGELREALQLTQPTFYRYQSLGKLERFELRPRIGVRRYSRKLVQEYLDGQPSSRTWGAIVERKRAGGTR